MTSDFHSCDSQKVYSPPCSVWIAKINNADNCPLKNFIAEAEYDIRRQDYFYFLGVHGVDEAELCMENLLNSLGFEKKMRNTYKDFDVFFEECESLIHKILEVYTKPCLVAHTILHNHGFDALKNISPRYAESFIAARLACGTRAATVNKDIRTLKRIFNLAIEPRGYMVIGNNPFGKIRQRKLSTKPVRYITLLEFQTLLNSTMDIWWKAFLSVAYTTGARTGEIVNLMWTDVDFEKNRIRIVSKEAHGDIKEWEPKDHEGRILPVPAGAMQLLADLQVTSAEGCPYAFVPAWRWEYIMKARESGKQTDARFLLNNLHRRFSTLRKHAGIAKCTLHDFRRSCITNLARELPIHVVQKLAGHSDINTTRLYYLAVDENDLEKARQVQQKILKTCLTDPLLTHFGKNEGFSGDARNETQP
jgi:integrase